MKGLINSVLTLLLTIVTGLLIIHYFLKKLWWSLPNNHPFVYLESFVSYEIMLKPPTRTKKKSF